MKITAIGEVLIDLTQESDEGIPRFAAYPGGAPANVAVAASRLGARTAFIGCVGKDAFGLQLVETLRSNGVDVSGVQETDAAQTTLAVVTVDETGERSFAFYRRPGADTLLSCERALGHIDEQTGVLHFGSVSLTHEASREATLAAARKARTMGKLVSYDPNYRASLWEDETQAVLRMREALPLADIVKISDEETALLTDHADPKEAAEALLAGGAKLALVTLGAAGVYYAMGDLRGTVPGMKVTVADTNGAGDTFFGAVLSRIAARGGISGLDRAELEGILRFANCAAALTTSRHGAIPAMPTLTEVQAVLSKN